MSKGSKAHTFSSERTSSLDFLLLDSRKLMYKRCYPDHPHKSFVPRTTVAAAIIPLTIYSSSAYAVEEAAP